MGRTLPHDTQSIRRCRARLLNKEDRKNAGYISEDRRGKKVFHALVTISLGLVKIEPGHYVSHHQIASAMADAKKQAKKILGNSLFIDRRQEPWLNEKTEDDTAQLELMTPLI